MKKPIKRRKTYSKKITCDHIIRFTGAGAEKKCPYELRKIRAVDRKTGSVIVLLTNIRGFSAEKTAGMYRKRWQIELFFKTIKQNLKIKRFYGTSENAVKTQIWIAMIVYLLYMMLRKLTGCISKCFTHFMSELSVSLFQHIDLNRWFSGSPPPAFQISDVSSLQMELGL
jgi:transposase